MSRRAGGRVAPAEQAALVAPTIVKTPAIPPSLAVGNQVHYYPRLGELPASTPGLLVTIAAVHSFDLIEVIHGGSRVRAVRGGRNGVLRGTRGTFDPLDHRHRRQFRIHLTPHAQDFAANLEADQALVTWWRDTAKVDIHLIVQSPDTQQALFVTTVDRYRALGFSVNYGFIPVAAAHSTPDDGVPVPDQSEYGAPYINAAGQQAYAKGMTSVWTNPAFWTPWAEHLRTYEALAGGKCDVWLHCQMEPAFISHPFAEDLAAAGYTVADLEVGMKPYLDAITATAKWTIVRPLSSVVDLALPLVVAAGAPGSVWCHEGTNTGAKRRRTNERGYQEYLGITQATLATIARFMPADSRGVPLKLENTFRIGGAREFEDPFAEGGTYAIHEIVDLNEGVGRVQQIGKTAWRRYTTKTQSLAGGTKQPSMNDVLAHWTVANDGLATINAVRCVGTGRGTANQTAIEPWLRRSNGTSVTTDAIDNGRPVGASGFTTPPLEANTIRGWRVGSTDTFVTADPANPSVAWESVTHVFDVTLPSVAPAPGVTWGIYCIAASNAHAMNIVWDGTTGQLLLNVRAAVGQDTVTYYASPVPGGTYRFVVAYDRNRDGSATGKWWTPHAGWVATSAVKNTTTVAPIIGGAHNLLNRAGELWGIPGLVMPYDSDHGFWNRANWSAAEMACLNTVTFMLTPTVSSSTTYSGTVDGVAWSYTSDSSATLAEVLAGIAAAIDAVTTATVTNTGAEVAVVRDGWLHVSRDDYRFLTCERSINRWPFGYNFD